jgi:putative methylase
VVGVEVDRTAVEAARESAVNVGLKAAVDWVNCDIGAVAGRFDTVLQNPPFGVQTRRADRRFLEKALEVGCAVYSLHNHPYSDKALLGRLAAKAGAPLQVAPSQFIARFVEARGGRVEAVYALLMAIPRMFDFHTKARRVVIVDLYVLKGEGTKNRMCHR